jgi:glutamyl-tRNA reductase
VTSSADQIVAAVTHARSVPAEARGRLAARVRADGSRSDLLVETCHRVEVYSIEPRTADRFPPDRPADGVTVLRGRAAIRHAISVAVGRDSVVVGEDQVLHQLRAALAAAKSAGDVDPVLERLFAMALRAGRRARSWSDGPSRSLADLAIERLREVSGDLSGRELLVVGSGEMGRLAILAGLAAGAVVAVTSRSSDKAATLAGAAGCRVDDFDPGRRAAGYAAVVVALAGPWAIGSETIGALAASDTLVVDLSVPPALPETLVDRLGPRLSSADDLARERSGMQPPSRRVLARLDALVDQTAEEFLAWLDGRDRRAAASALVQRADAERAAELAELWRRLPDLGPEARATIERMSEHLAERLLREPLERLGADVDGRHERAVRELWAL